MRASKKTTLAVAGVALAVLGGVGFFFRQSRLAVNLVHPKRGAIVESVYGLGTVTAVRTYNLKIGVLTHVVRFFASEGDRVEKGAPLLELLDAGVQRAPFSGTVTTIPYKVGETVFPQSTVLSLVDLSDLYVLVSLEQQSVLRVRPGQPARLSFESLRGEKVMGTVKAVYPSEGQFLVRVSVERFPKEVLPNMTVDVAIEVDKRENALLVPVSAVQAGRVSVVRGGRRQKLDLKIGAVDGEWAEVLSGELSPEDSVVVVRGS